MIQHPYNDRKKQKPLVSIGMPLYNEGRFVAEALHSLLAQDYGALEIIVSDNASTDETGDICRSFAESDKRIRYSRSPKNLGVGENFRRVFEAAAGTYFMWAAGHDLWSGNLISECVDLLEDHPDAALAFGSNVWIDGSGGRIGKETGWTDTRGLDIYGRYFTTLWGTMNPVLGVIRKAYLLRASQVMQRSCVGTDLILLTHLALQGDFLHAKEAEWSRRQFRSTENHAARMDRYRSHGFGLAKSSLDRLFPLARLPLWLIRVVAAADAPLADKLAILFLLFASLPVRYLAGRRQHGKKYSAP